MHTINSKKLNNITGKTYARYENKKNGIVKLKKQNGKFNKNILTARKNDIPTFLTVQRASSQNKRKKISTGKIIAV